MSFEDYTKLIHNTEKVLEEVDKNLLKISDAALNSQKLESSRYSELIQLRMSMGEYLKELRTELLKSKKIEAVRKEYAEYISDNKAKVESSLFRYTSVASDDGLKGYRTETKKWEDQLNQELADKILEIQLMPL